MPPPFLPPPFLSWEMPAPAKASTAAAVTHSRRARMKFSPFSVVFGSHLPAYPTGWLHFKDTRLLPDPHHLDEKTVGVAELRRAGYLRSLYGCARLFQFLGDRRGIKGRGRHAKMVHSRALAGRRPQQPDSRLARLKPDAMVIPLRRRPEDLLVKRRGFLRIGNVQQNVIEPGGLKDRFRNGVLFADRGGSFQGRPRVLARKLHADSVGIRDIQIPAAGEIPVGDSELFKITVKACNLVIGDARREVIDTRGFRLLVDGEIARPELHVPHRRLPGFPDRSPENAGIKPGGARRIRNRNLDMVERGIA